MVPEPFPSRSGRPPSRFIALIAVLALGSGCAATPSPYLALEQTPQGDSTRLRLVAVAGARINARNKPALEQPDGRILRFASPQISPDTNYFIASPEVVVAGKPGGRVLASVCPKGERVCRTVSLQLR